MEENKKCDNCNNCDEILNAEIGFPVPNMEFEYFQKKSDGEKIEKTSINNYKGKWLILFFYPADFTFICPTELEEMAQTYAKFKELEAEVISVSTDTVWVHKAWHDSSPAISKIEFPMASDPTGEMSMVMNTYIYEEGVSLRGSFIINPEGILVASEINDNSIGRNAKELLRKLQAAKFVAENNGKVCPASWEPGKDILEPGLGLVGKI